MAHTTGFYLKACLTNSVFEILKTPDREGLMKDAIKLHHGKCIHFNEASSAMQWGFQSRGPEQHNAGLSGWFRSEHQDILAFAALILIIHFFNLPKLCRSHNSKSVECPFQWRQKHSFTLSKRGCWSEDLRAYSTQKKIWRESPDIESFNHSFQLWGWHFYDKLIIT